jgi:molybdopterin synthase catalytic subunit
MIKVQPEAFDVGEEIAQLTKDNTSIGGIVSFVGTVREMSGSSAIKSMTLEHYPGMTERALEEIETQANQRWPLKASLIIHRYGKLAPGEGIVLVITASAHRQAAFEACEFLMDWLKTKAPFWKLEENDEGGNWVDAREEDTAATQKWATESTD